MVSRENGPLDLFAKLRAHFARKQSRIGGMFDLISCVGCTSVYVGSVTALWAAQDVFGWMMYTLSFSAFATIVERLYYRGLS